MIEKHQNNSNQAHFITNFALSAIFLGLCDKWTAPSAKNLIFFFKYG